MNAGSLLAILLHFTLGASGQSLEQNWKFKTSGPVLAGPLYVDGKVFIGDMNGKFFAIDAENGKEIWSFETDGNIQAKATSVGGNIFFESANVFYLLNGDGDVLWKYDQEILPFVFKYKEHEWPYKIDPYDDKRSVASYHEGVIYAGSSDGSVYAFEAKTGKVQKRFVADEKSPVRSSPFIHEGQLFFGDWNGLVYCYDLKSGALEWKKKTYRGDKPYGTFGGVVSEFTTYNGLLFFGARNYMLNVLEITTGEKDWTFTDPKRGWIIGDPVVYNDTLYIGGSDNFSMYAFHPNIGQPFWSHNGKKNIYTKPLVTDDHVIFTTGNGYDPNDSGKLFVLDRMTGTELSVFETPMGSFSSPVFAGDHIVFGSYDEHVYSLKLKD
ncbi:MAG: hypothetical protein Tsb0034_22610 [Ekhidna sp.]